MKQMYLAAFLTVFFFSAFSASGQIINFPDSHFKNALVVSSPGNGIAKDIDGNAIAIDANGDGEIEVSEALTVYQLDINTQLITSVAGIENFSNLTLLDCTSNIINDMDLTALGNLQVLKCSNNEMETINITGLTNLDTVRAFSNDLTTVDLSGLTSLTELSLSSNQITSLDASPAVNLESLIVAYGPLNSLTLGSLPNLTYLECVTSNLTSLDVTGCPNLESLLCFDNEITALDLSGMASLEIVNATDNAFDSITLANNTNLQILNVAQSNLTTLDISECPNLTQLSCYDNALETLFLKNGTDEFVDISGNPDLEYICCDEEQFNNILDLIMLFEYDTNLNTYCSFTPGGTFYTVAGNSNYDFNANGCDATDPPVSYLQFDITDGTTSGSFIANNSGAYSIEVPEGSYTITPQVEVPEYFTITPSNLVVNFPTDPSPFAQDFCVVADGVHPDLDVTIIPLEPARPGFDASYRISYSNKGNQVQSGDVTITYLEPLMAYVSSDPVFDSETLNSYTWDFVDLLPFETRTIDIVFTINAPTATPPVDIDDVLVFTADIAPLSGDETPLDNQFVLDQVVVGSFDPNDIRCLQGESISPEAVGGYVHYLIRFENTGTFPAENIVVVDEIDPEFFDVETMRPLNGSHDFVTRVTGQKVEFIFEGIDLPFNDEDNDGFVLFKIETVPGLGLGDSFSNSAEIFFDFNFPIVTNTYTTTIEESLGTAENNFSETISVYPNPSKDILYIAHNNQVEIASIEILDLVGKSVFMETKNTSELDISSLQSGAYFLRVASEKGVEVLQFIKE
ncbi:DUF7619 domain-containing protein [Marinirhabdus gelatinilytica]|uniref:Putative repeat protein (TIGR01451 family)/predicted secreted protein (Por secretion system target) n=1 Tax=Marinirhabdus gelatinilytica TaxID=1703343 RepID=A0A370QJZ8_9FLAO|nr:T9SS type A sorting domain-containing protein [Marinirhabdus gelatinilytica]RDK88684.1 putative repeat protein (TIGR01451 family)/predicted secreted protein (Por secretion system target) [Marinirhabdus gelatinilytica]